MERLNELAEMLNRAKKILESEGKDLDKAIKEFRYAKKPDFLLSGFFVYRWQNKFNNL